MMIAVVMSSTIGRQVPSSTITPSNQRSIASKTWTFTSTDRHSNLVYFIQTLSVAPSVGDLRLLVISTSDRSWWWLQYWSVSSTIGRQVPYNYTFKSTINSIKDLDFYNTDRHVIWSFIQPFPWHPQLETCVIGQSKNHRIMISMNFSVVMSSTIGRQVPRQFDTFKSTILASKTFWLFFTIFLQIVHVILRESLHTTLSVAPSRIFQTNCVLVKFCL